MYGFLVTLDGMTQAEVFAAGAAAAVAVIAVIVLVIALFSKRFRARVVHYPQQGEARTSQQIYTELVELRALTSADRAMVLRFHNGMEFLPSNPVWKLTCTHEFAKNGVEYCAGDYQAVLASRTIRMVGTLLTGESDDDGVRVARECLSCDNAQSCVAGNRRMVVMQFDEMSAGFEKFVLQENNVKTALVCGMTFEGKVVGFVMLHFCDAKLDTEEGLREAIRTLCESSNRIQYLIGSKTL